MVSEKFDDLYRIYCATFSSTRSRIDLKFKQGDGAVVTAEATVAGMVAIALGTEDGSSESRPLKSESRFCAAMLGALDSTPALREHVVTRAFPEEPSSDERRQIEEAVVGVASSLGSWTTAAEVFAKVEKRVMPTALDRHRDFAFALCEQAAKRHNASLEGR